MAIFRFFKMAAAAILNFKNFKIFNGRNGQEDGTALLCQISSKSLETRPRYGVFGFFKMAAVAILNFWNFEFLTVGRVTSVKLRHRAKFVEIVRTVTEICEFQYYANLAWKCLFTPLFGVFGSTFSRMMSLIILTPKKPSLGWTRHLSHKPRVFSYRFLNGHYN